MNPKETEAFHGCYMHDKSTAVIAAQLMVSEQIIYVLIGQLESKCDEFTIEKS